MRASLFFQSLLPKKSTGKSAYSFTSYEQGHQSSRDQDGHVPRPLGWNCSRDRSGWWLTGWSDCETKRGHEEIFYSAIQHNRSISEYSNGTQLIQKGRNDPSKKCISKGKVLLVFGMKMIAFTLGKWLVIIIHLHEKHGVFFCIDFRIGR